ncbi:MAG: DUF1109 domain-containing protein, partial [Ramlibacter sp.]
MKTDELVALLSGGALPVEPHLVARRFTLALGLGGLGAVLLMALAMGVRPDISGALQLPVFWMKLAFPATLAAAGLVAAEHLSRPGMRVGGVWFALALPLLLVWLMAMVSWVDAAPGERQALVLGTSWELCPLSIAVVSIPVFIALFWAMKGMAPTRPVLAGAGAGLVAGAVGAFAYAFHCTEMAAPFVAIWYVAG